MKLKNVTVLKIYILVQVAAGASLCLSNYAFAVSEDHLAAYSDRRPILVPAQVPVDDTKSPIENFHTVLHGKIYRGAQPDSVGLNYLKSIGVKTILNLRNLALLPVKREEQMARSLGMNHLWVPLETFAPPNPNTVHMIENEILANPANYPIYVHCWHGEDRTGLVIGLYRTEVQKPAMSAEAAYNEMVKYGYHEYLYPLSRFYTSETGYEPRVSCASTFNF